MVRLYVSARRSKIRLLWTKRRCRLLSALSDNITREVAEYLADTIERLPGLEGRSIRMYDLWTGKVQVGTVPVRFSVGTVTCVLDNDWAACVGGHPANATAYLLSLEDFSAPRISDMYSARGWPGVLRYDDWVYVFGGYSGLALREVEKLSLDSLTWTSVEQTTHPMHAFSPCRFHEDIYLPELCHHEGVLEVLHVPTELYRCIPIVVPLRGCSSAAFIHGEEIIIVTVNLALTRWRIGAIDRFEVCPVHGRDFLELPSQCVPVSFSGNYFFVEYITGDLICFNPNSFRATIKRFPGAK